MRKAVNNTVNKGLVSPRLDQNDVDHWENQDLLEQSLRSPVNLYQSAPRAGSTATPKTSPRSPSDDLLNRLEVKLQTVRMRAAWARQLKISQTESMMHATPDSIQRKKEAQLRVLSALEDSLSKIDMSRSSDEGSDTSFGSSRSETSGFCETLKESIVCPSKNQRATNLTKSSNSKAGEHMVSDAGYPKAEPFPADCQCVEPIAIPLEIRDDILMEVNQKKNQPSEIAVQFSNSTLEAAVDGQTPKHMAADASKISLVSEAASAMELISAALDQSTELPLETNRGGLLHDVHPVVSTGSMQSPSIQKIGLATSSVPVLLAQCEQISTMHSPARATVAAEGAVQQVRTGKSQDLESASSFAVMLLLTTAFISVSASASIFVHLGWPVDWRFCLGALLVPAVIAAPLLHRRIPRTTTPQPPQDTAPHPPSDDGGAHLQDGINLSAGSNVSGPALNQFDAMDPETRVIRRMEHAGSLESSGSVPLAAAGLGGFDVVMPAVGVGEDGRLNLLEADVIIERMATNCPAGSEPHVIRDTAVEASAEPDVRVATTRALLPESCSLALAALPENLPLLRESVTPGLNEHTQPNFADQLTKASTVRSGAWKFALALVCLVAAVAVTEYVIKCGDRDLRRGWYAVLLSAALAAMPVLLSLRSQQQAVEINVLPQVMKQTSTSLDMEPCSSQTAAAANPDVCPMDCQQEDSATRLPVLLRFWSDKTSVKCEDTPIPSLSRSTSTSSAARSTSARAGIGEVHEDLSGQLSSIHASPETASTHANTDSLQLPLTCKDITVPVTARAVSAETSTVSDFATKHQMQTISCDYVLPLWRKVVSELKDKLVENCKSLNTQILNATIVKEKTVLMWVAAITIGIIAVFILSVHSDRFWKGKKTIYLILILYFPN